MSGFIYSIIVLIIVLMGVSSYIMRNPFRFLHGMFTWFMIFILIIMAYSYSGQLDIKGHFLSNIMPGVVRIDGETIVVQKNQNGQFFIEAAVNGKDILFLVDTGASEVVLTKEDAFKIDRLAPNLNSKDFHTGNGKVTTNASRADIQIGNTHFPDTELFITNGDQGISVLGMSVLSRFSSVSFSSNELRLVP